MSSSVPRKTSGQNRSNQEMYTAATGAPAGNYGHQQFAQAPQPQYTNNNQQFISNEEMDRNFALQMQQLEAQGQSEAQAQAQAQLQAQLQAQAQAQAQQMNGYTPVPQVQQRPLSLYPQDMAPASPPSPRASSNQLARRNETYSRALVPVPARNTFDPQSSNQYASAENALVPAINVDPGQQVLLEAVARAEKVAQDAQGDRAGNAKKSIPPFVQKLAT